MTCAATRSSAAHLARLTAYAGLAIAAFFLVGAAIAGLELGFEATPVAAALFLYAALYYVCRRHERAGGDERLATAAGSVLVLFGGGLAGGLICLVGQTFALPFIDPVLHRADLLLGINLQAVIAALVEVPGLPVLLAFAYNSSFPLVFVSVLAFAWRGRAERAWELCGVFNLCLLVATISSAVIPAVGPFHYLGIPALLTDALPPGSGTYHLEHLFALREADRFVIDPSQLQGVATFPSFHMALALMTAAAWRDVPRIGVAMAAWQSLVVLSTIPIGGHYVVDLVAGAGCWALAHFAWHKRVTGAATSRARSDDGVPALA